MDPPRTADGDAFRFRAGRLSLDLCSTLLWRHLTPVELLLEPGDLARWFGEAGVHPVPATARPEDVDAARALREGIYVLAHDRMAGRPLTESPLATLNAIAAHPDPAPALTPDGRITWAADAPMAAALSCVARDAVDVLTAVPAARLRECAAPDCAFLFIDSSRPGRRRWCASDRCGNRQHVREHRARR
jgi:predicted RNA-binding Zn ribbon-like protein